MQIHNLPPHITLEYLLSRCQECPICGKPTQWVSRDKVRPPTIDVTIEGKKTKLFVRRVVWRLMHPTGRLPDGKTSVVTSKCTNAHCIDPEAVFATTKSKAYQAAAARGVWGGPKASAVSVRAAKKRSKLPDDGVTDIISTTTPTKDAAEKWGVSTAYVRMLRCGRWRRDITAKVNPFAGPAGLLR